jgi:hypothetical protein
MAGLDPTIHVFGPMQPSKSTNSRDRDKTGFTAIVKSSLPRSQVAGFDTILIKDRLRDGIGRTVVPSRIVIKIELDRRDRASANVRTSPAAGSRQEFNSNFEI